MNISIIIPVPFIDIEKAIKSSVGTTTPVFSVSKTLNRLLITTSASALAKTIVQLGPKLNTKLALNHHPPPPPPGTFQSFLGILGG